MSEHQALLRCPACGAVNRVSADRLRDQPKCGKCSNLLEVTGKPVDVSATGFEREVLQWPGAVLVEFWAQWCGYCRMIAPAIDALARAKAGLVKVVRVNVDKAPELAQRFGIRATPTFLLYRNGNKVNEIGGALPGDQLEIWIESSLKS
ncbi:MAG: thioredoxin TrxC [Nitrospirota bacterium]